jgi:2-dehydropantoate 2-reductase
MRIAIVGVGGLGGTLAAMLSRAGHEVVAIARGEHLKAIQRDGLRLESEALGSFTARLHATDDLARAAGAEAILVTVKTFQLAELAGRLPKARLVLPLVNGVDAADVLPGSSPGACFVFSWQEAPGVIQHKGPAPRVLAGAGAEELCLALREAGADAQVVPDIGAALWEKLLFVEPFGAVGAASRSTAGVVRAVPETRELLERAMREVEAVARGLGVNVAKAAVASALNRIDSLAPDSTSSMQRDLRDGRRSEVRELTGAVTRHGRAAGVGTPVHDFLYACLLPQQRG